MDDALGTVHIEQALDSARDAIMLIDASGRIVLVNSRLSAMFGYPRGDVIGRHLAHLLPGAADAWGPVPSAAELIEHGPRLLPATDNALGRRRDGTVFAAEVFLSAFEAVEHPLVAAAIRDVTDQRRGAADSARLAAIVRSSSDAIVSQSLDGTITSWNRGAELLYGFTESEMLGRNIGVLIPAERREQEHVNLARSAAGELVSPYESERLRGDGSVAAMSVTMSPLADAVGTIVGISTVARDLSERQQADARFSGLLEATPLATICVDVEGTIILTNAAAEALFEYHRDQMIGQSIEMLVPDSSTAGHAAHRAQYGADLEPRSMGTGAMLTGRRRDGTEFPAEISLSSLRDGDDVTILATVRDITERLAEQAEAERLHGEAQRGRLERLVQQSQRLDSIGQLAGGVAHDFNNLLGVILNYTAFACTELARADAEDPTEPWAATRGDLEQVVAAAQRAARLTRQLLTFARGEVTHPEVLDLNTVVTGVEELLTRTIGEHIDLSFELAPRLPPVSADPGLLEQAFLNLAVNARDAMSEGGRLTIETDVIIDDTYSDFQGEVGAYVRVRVSDTGTGMSADDLKRAMDPFFTTKPEGMGTGLGLATVYFNVTQMRGRFELTSEEGIGTTAAILLPVTDATPEHTPRSVLEKTGGGGETVLVVEDEDAMREVTRRLLTLHGYNVLTAASGAEALALAAENAGEIHLLLTDVVMPHMLGTEVARRLCARRPTLRVLFMSGYAHTGRGPDEPLEVGSVLLEKPFSQRSLLAKVHQLLGSGGSPSTNEVIVQDTTATQEPTTGVTETAAIRVLLVDDHLMFVESVQRVLGADASFAVVGVAETCAHAVELAAALQPDVAIIDYRLPDGDGAYLTTRIRALSPATQVLILTGLRDDRSFAAAMAAGCAGFLTKNRAFNDLVDAVRRVHAGDTFLPTELLSNLLPRLRVGFRPVGHDLTTRELEILGYLAQGLSTEAMAQRLMLSIHTVRNHVQRILTKLGAHSKLEAVAVAARSGILDEIG